MHDLDPVLEHGLERRRDGLLLQWPRKGRQHGRIDPTIDAVRSESSISGGAGAIVEGTGVAGVDISQAAVPSS